MYAIRSYYAALAQAYGVFGNRTPDVDDPALLKSFFGAVQSMNRDGLLLAYHDRSDGGLFATLAEMAFASHTGIEAKESAQPVLGHGQKSTLALIDSRNNFV